VFIRERANGLYGPGIWVLANTVTVLPYLFACTFLFSVISYFAIGLHPGGTAFFRFVAYLFLGVFAAESQSMLVAAAIPIFVAALAIASFLNGFWMVGLSFSYIPYDPLTFDVSHPPNSSACRVISSEQLPSLPFGTILSISSSV
jgi:ABC-type multidrug transport system permease subunit